MSQTELILDSLHPSADIFNGPQCKPSGAAGFRAFFMSVSGYVCVNKKKKRCYHYQSQATVMSSHKTTQNS